MIISFFIIGVIASTVGALPLGASNIAVINTTIKENTKQAFKIAITAGISEVILSYYALHCNMAVKDFFDRNMWIQIVIVIILMVIGSYLIFKSKKEERVKPSRLSRSKYATGFLLGILNPPVLIYWIVAFGTINNNNLILSLSSSLFVLFLFFAGVYTGKVATLYLYSKFSLAIKNRVQNITLVINKVTGVLLIIIGLAQAIKLSF
ncbi:LysE family transporter [uncultured Psychroserpens sp.]|uniref:LysE family transporter n=1 Tax=uncultured Psychroserpens sp. TaxID=255436 RepID=UPI002602B0FD|nr:LysE family transporter [uncultured Psychroserpens sp.]